MKKFAILGYGFIGAVHAATIKKVDGMELVAVVEKDRAKWNSVTEGNIDVEGIEPLDVPIFESIEDMLKEIKADCLSICLPTFLHREYTAKAMAAGLDVVCEKPMALSLEDCDAMIAASKKYEKQLYIAQCIRFWPEYQVLKKLHDSGELGAAKSFRFDRLSGMPSWGGEQSWFLQDEKSGGCQFDLHVHDIDFAQYLLGRPRAVHARSVELETGANVAVVSEFIYDNNFTCTLEGSWLYFSGFKMSFSAVYENGQVDFDSTQSPSLKVWRKGTEEPEIVTVPESDGYVEEYKYFLKCMNEGTEPIEVTPASTRQSIQLALAERASMKQSQIVEV
jgi:predicted dehydrogenase